MDRTEQGLYRKLAESEYPEELIFDAIEYVKKYHYIDDMRYARNYISYRQGSKSRRRLQQELMQKGVPKEITEQALEEIYENNDTEKIAEILKKSDSAVRTQLCRGRDMLKKSLGKEFHI